MGKYALRCKLHIQKYARNMQQYAYQICRNMQKYAKHMCIISSNMLKDAKRYAHT